MRQRSTKLWSQGLLEREIREETILSPRFYTTDIAALDRIDVEPVRQKWEELLTILEDDPNRLHFRRRSSFVGIVEALPSAVCDEFVAFMISSMTSKFSGCVLYSEIARRTTNLEIRRLMRLLTRDESRHAGFLKDSRRARQPVVPDEGQEIALFHTQVHPLRATREPAVNDTSGAPEGNRTPDLRFRKPSLYPAELRAHAGAG